MASYPGTPSKYPGSPANYPVSPGKYPGTGASVYPGGASQPTTPATILGATLLQWCRADLGITLGAGVAAWADQSGNARDYVQGTAGAQPTWSATSGPNSTPGLTFDAVDDFLDNSGFALPAPGTTPYYLVMVLKQISWTSNRRHAGDKSTAACSLVQLTSTPSIGQRNGSSVNANNAATIGNFWRVIARYNNSTGDYVQVGSVSVTGANSGNTAGGTGRQIGAAASALFVNQALAEIFYATGDYATNAAALDAYFSGRYGASILA